MAGPADVLPQLQGVIGWLGHALLGKVCHAGGHVRHLYTGGGGVMEQAAQGKEDADIMQQIHEMHRRLYCALTGELYFGQYLTHL